MRFIRRDLWAVLAILTLSGCNLSPEAKEAKFLAKGKKEFDKKNYAVAILDFKNAAEAKPWDAEPNYQLGQSYQAGGDTRLAGVYFQKATELNPRNTGAQLKLAQLMVATSSDKETLEAAQGHAQTVLALLPEDPDALNVLGLADLRLGKPENAQAWLERAVRKAPGNVTSWAVLAKVRTARNDIAGAENALLQATGEAPNSSEARRYLGEFYLAHSRAPEAEQQFHQAVSLDPGNGPALMDLAALQVKTGQAAQADQTYRQLAALSDRQFRPLHAEFLFNSGKRDQAVAELGKLAGADPEDINVRTKLVETYLAMNRPGDAEKVLNAAVKKNGTDIVALMQRGRLYLSLGKLAEAQADMNDVLRFQKNSAEAHYVLAKVAEGRANSHVQRQELEEALQADPTFLSARIDLAQVLLSSRDAQAALLLVDEAPKDQMNAVAVVLKRNWALLSLKRTAEARRGIDRVLASGKVPEALVQDAAMKLDQKNYAGARKSAEEALTKTPGDVRALTVLVGTYTAQKQTAAAVQRMRAFAQSHPESAPLQRFVGQLLVAQGDRAGARKAFEAAKAARPDFVEADYSLAELDAGEGKVDDARKRLLAVETAHSDNKNAHLMLAEFEISTGNNPAAAIEQFRKVVAIDPKDASSWNDLAYLLTQGKQLDEALKCAQKAKELAPDSPDVDGTLGWVYYQQGAYPLAVVHLETATAKGGVGKNPAIRQYYLAMAYLKDGKPDRGRQTLDAALKLNPNLPEAQAARQAFGISAK